jgi:hypothetical protein
MEFPNSDVLLRGGSLWLPFRSGEPTEVPIQLIGLCTLLADRPWPESAEIVISNIVSAIRANTTYALPLSHMKVWVFLLGLEIDALTIICHNPSGVHNATLLRVLAVWNAFENAFRARVGDSSAQGKYAEAKVNAASALRELPTTLIDEEEFPDILAFCKERCSREISEYMVGEVKLDIDKFLDMLQMLAHDQKSAFEVTNPPARIRAALSREERRQERVTRERWMPPTPEHLSGLEDLRYVESGAIATIDWERGCEAVDLTPDQTRAMEAKMEGLNLQSSEAPEYLGWPANRVARVRRSLEHDRPIGKALRERFADYDPAHISCK